MEKTVKCFGCGGQVAVSERLGETGKWFHPECYEEFTHKEKLITYIIILFDFFSSEDAPYIMNCRRMATSYVKKNGYTYKGIWQALVYFYEVKKHSKQKSQKRIGIVPYVYDEAELYFRQLDKKKQTIMESKFEELRVKRDIEKLKKAHEEVIEIIDINI